MRVIDLARLYVIFPALVFCIGVAAVLFDGAALQPDTASTVGVISLLLMSTGAWVFIQHNRKAGAILTMVAALAFSWWMISVVSTGFVSWLVLCASLIGAFCLVVVAFGGRVSVIRSE